MPDSIPNTVALDGHLLKHLDEVGALVFDPGHCTFRIGYAGEELPKVVRKRFF